MQKFKSILEFQKAFSTDAKCLAQLELERWNGTPACPFCGSLNVHRHPNKKKFNCREKGCRKIFSATVGTIFENTKLPLTKWYLAIYILSVHSKGISSLQLANWLNCTQATAWFLNHRIREMLTDNKPDLLEGVVEVDETYIGGLESNKHKHKRIAKAGIGGKAMVVGAVQRGGKVKTKVVPVATTKTLGDTISEFIKPGSFMVTDEHRGYRGTSKNFIHFRVNHKNKEYVRGDIHTNSIEGYWSILKRQIDGIHHSVSPQHLQRYCNENAFRYNSRALTQDERFSVALANCEGRLKYQDLVLRVVEQ